FRGDPAWPADDRTIALLGMAPAVSDGAATRLCRRLYPPQAGRDSAFQGVGRGAARAANAGDRAVDQSFPGSADRLRWHASQCGRFLSGAELHADLSLDRTRYLRNRRLHRLDRLARGLSGFDLPDGRAV